MIFKIEILANVSHVGGASDYPIKLYASPWECCGNILWFVEIFFFQTHNLSWYTRPDLGSCPHVVLAIVFNTKTSPDTMVPEVEMAPSPQYPAAQ